MKIILMITIPKFKLLKSSKYDFHKITIVLCYYFHAGNYCGYFLPWDKFIGEASLLYAQLYVPLATTASFFKVMNGVKVLAKLYSLAPSSMKPLISNS